MNRFSKLNIAIVLITILEVLTSFTCTATCPLLKINIVFEARDVNLTTDFQCNESKANNQNTTQVINRILEEIASLQCANSANSTIIGNDKNESIGITLTTTANPDDSDDNHIEVVDSPDDKETLKIAKGTCGWCKKHNQNQKDQENQEDHHNGTEHHEDYEDMLELNLLRRNLNSRLEKLSNGDKNMSDALSGTVQGLKSRILDNGLQKVQKIHEQFQGKISNVSDITLKVSLDDKH